MKVERVRRLSAEIRNIIKSKLRVQFSVQFASAAPVLTQIFVNWFRSKLEETVLTLCFLEHI